MLAPCGNVAAIIGAGITVIAVGSWTGSATPIQAGIANGTRIAVVARRSLIGAYLTTVACVGITEGRQAGRVRAFR